MNLYSTASDCQAEQEPGIPARLLVVLIALLGLALRLWHIDKQPLWLDELGVAQAAFKPTLFDALRVVNDHVMAMPMDYAIAWVTAQIAREEGFLRLPEAIWGLLTLIAVYQLCRELFEDRAASLLAMLMSSLSPLLIQYSQELRFYSPLTFFSVLSTWLGLRAVIRSRRRDWVIFTLSALAGLSFHFFSILVMVTVSLWVASYYGKDGWAERRSYLAVCALLYLAAFLAGVVIFGNTDAGNGFSLFQFEGLVSFLLTGVGWKPPFPATFASWIPGILLCGSAMVGVIATLRKDPKSPASILIYSVIVQSGLVVLFDYLGGYFIFSRQIIMLTPLMALFSAFGARWGIEKIFRRVGGPRENSEERTGRISLLFGLCYLLLVMPSLREYYQLQKTSTREILSILSRDWQEGEPIYTDLGSEHVYAYYGSQREGTRALIGAIFPLVVADENQLPSTGPAWVIIRHPLPKADEKFMRAAGFTPVYIPPQNTLYAQALWKR